MEDWNLTGIESIGLDPNDPTRLYLAAGTYTQSWAPNGAMLLSADRGNSFQTVRMPIKMGGNNNGRNAGERLAVDPNDGRVLYFGSRLNGLWRSTDWGLAWSQVTTFPVTAAVNGADAGVVFVQFLRSSGVAGATTPVIYVGVSATGTAGTPMSLYRSTDAGATWSRFPATLPHRASRQLRPTRVRTRVCGHERPRGLPRGLCELSSQG
jgi:xyloglucan-specific exo-beta-1,4-glucanase